MLVATPVRPGGVQQPEVLEVRRVRDVRSLAQIDEGPVGVGRDDLVLRKLAEPLELQWIVEKTFARLGLGYFFAHEREFLGHHLFHLRVELLEIFRRERLIYLEIETSRPSDGLLKRRTPGVPCLLTFCFVRIVRIAPFER